MADLERPFSSFVKQHRPLQAKLNEYVQPLEQELRAVRSLADLSKFEREAEEVLTTPNPPRILLGGRRSASVRPGEWAARSDGTKVAVTRHYVAVQLSGDFLLCCVWPGGSDDLLAADDPSWPESELSTLDARERVWSLEPVGEGRGKTEWALYTYLDLTLEDEARIARREIDPTHIINERIGRITPVLDRINQQLEEFFTKTLPEQLTSAIERSRQELTNRRAVTEAFRFPDEWVVEPIRLEDTLVAPIVTEPARAAPSAIGPIEILQVPRLEPASFERLQTTIRLWADAIERHPGGFAPLGEDQISDLLAATLNATLAGANREVFSRSGKTDIYVRADVFGEGRGPAKVFVAENKKATSHAVVRSAVENQLFNYLTTTDLSAVLLLLFPQKHFLKVRDDYLATLRGIEGFLDQHASSVEGWPVYRYRHDDRTLSVCVAMVHLS